MFEKKNNQDPLSVSFLKDHLKADFCFEFSSEGEYQQVASLIDDALLLGKKIELVFFSPSVEKTITELGTKFPGQIRYLRYPLLHGSFLKWISARHLILVRYDLFPELLVWANRSENRLSMVWMSFKKERMRKKKISRIKRAFLKQAHKIFYASEKDAAQGLSLGVSGEIYDFRMEQIRRRIEKRADKFQERLPVYQELEKRWMSYPRHKRLLFGNVWPSDLFLLKDLPRDVFVLILPHQLTPQVIAEFKTAIPVAQEIFHYTEILPAGNVFILNTKGVLCELYADFGKAYVGGGFGVSIHSILEPLVAGVEQIAAGPKNDRSTEFDLADQLGHLTEVHNSDEFYRWLTQETQAFGRPETLRPFLNRYDVCKKELISC